MLKIGFIKYINVSIENYTTETLINVPFCVPIINSESPINKIKPVFGSNVVNSI